MSGRTSLVLASLLLLIAAMLAFCHPQHEQDIRPLDGAASTPAAAVANDP